MDYSEISKKIDIVIKTIDARIQKLDTIVRNYSNKVFKKDENIQKYRYELERNNYYIIKYSNEREKSRLFKNRCIYYKEYLKYKELGDILNIKRNEYNIIKTLQDETIFYFTSVESELQKKALIQRIVGREETALDKIQSLRQDRDKKYRIFLNKEFTLDEDRLYTLDYLNYDINEVTDLVYKKQSKKKAS